MSEAHYENVPLQGKFLYSNIVLYFKSVAAFVSYGCLYRNWSEAFIIPEACKCKYNSQVLSELQTKRCCFLTRCLCFPERTPLAFSQFQYQISSITDHMHGKRCVKLWNLFEQRKSDWETWLHAVEVCWTFTGEKVLNIKVCKQIFCKQRKKTKEKN